MFITNGSRYTLGPASTTGIRTLLGLWLLCCFTSTTDKFSLLSLKLLILDVTKFFFKVHIKLLHCCVILKVFACSALL